VCRRCNVPMTQGMAIPPAIQCSDEGTCSYAMWSTKAPLVPVWKCPKCGHSITTHTVPALAQSGGEKTKPKESNS
jgi:hypothetical protein